MVATSDQLEYLLAQAGLRARIEGHMTALFTDLASRNVDPRVIRAEITELARSLVAAYGQAAATFAADWYNDMRLTAGVRGRFVATEFTQDFDVQIGETVRRATGDLFGDPNITGFVKTVAGKSAQYALDGARNTVTQNAYRDPLAAGWVRVPVGATCDFCLMLVGRGGVYKKSTVSFRSHLNCDCGAAPSWDLDAVEVPEIAYEASSRMQGLRNRAASGDREAQRQLDAYHNRVSAYIDNNQGQFAQLRRTYNLTPAA